MAEIIQVLDPTQFQLQSYSNSDTELIPQFDFDTELISGSTFIEFVIYNPNRDFLFYTPNYTNYTLNNDSVSTEEGISQFNIDPLNDLKSRGFENGQYVTYYNFLTYRIGTQFQQLYISEISSDRTEIRLDSTQLETDQILNQTEDFIDYREDQIYFEDFLLNFGNNDLVLANNIKLDGENTSDPTILIKLYEPLPPQFDLKSQLYIVTLLSQPEAYSIVIEPEVIPFTNSFNLQGPNFNIPIKNQVNNSSQNLSSNDILLGSSTESLNELQGLLSQSAINISIDYNNYNEFIHFSSAQTRLENFYYKASLLEQYSGSISALQSTSGSSTSITLFENKISSIITNFDGYDKFLYYQSGSNSWPKTNSTKPYKLAKTGSIEVIQWYGSLDENNSNFGGQLISSSNYDNANPDELKKAIPEYLREDPANQQYDLFVDMVAQYYDNVWLYTKDVTQKYNADNRLDFGVSKDLVSDAIKDFGIKLYQNNFSNQELYTAFLGITPNGSLFPFPEITGSIPVPTGFEFVDTLISASNDVISMDDTNKSLYKRIYHNIPYLLKSKGTLTGLRALITSYGIPDTILKISEFGGKDKVNANDYDLYFNNFNRALEVGPNTNFITSSWAINSSWGAASLNNRPSTIQFRFKPEKFPPTNLSQSLWIIADGTSDPIELRLEYSGSGLDSGSLVNDSGSYDGSIKDPYYQYATLRLLPEAGSSTPSASVYLPFFDGGWWSAMVRLDGGNSSLFAGNKIYNGNDGTSLGYYSSSIAVGADSSYWVSANKSYFATSSILNPTTHPAFSGSLQEIRYYNTRISESVFKDYVMNPLSIEGNEVNSAPDQLIFRAALGSELLQTNYSSSEGTGGYGFTTYGNGLYGQTSTETTTKFSIHPKVTGSWATTSSFDSNSNFYFNNTPSYSKNTEYFFLDQPAVGIKNRTTDKIRSESDTLPSGSVLSPIRKLSQTTEASASYTDNINYLEVAFSPQNQINDDIIGQLGHFNIGDYIGDPAQRFTGNNYPDLNNLSEEYFKKYIKQYDLVDFVRLIKFFDNSLFKMIKDFIPARTSLASGLVIKQHLLERNKYKQPTVQSPVNELLTGSIQSKQIWNTASQATEMSSSLIESFSGGAAGMFNPFNNEYEFFISSSITTLTVNTNVSASLLEPSLLSYNSGDAPAGGGLYIDVTSQASYSQNAHNISYFNTYISEGNALYAVAFLTDNLDSNLNPLQGSSALNFFLDGDGRPTPIAKLSSILTTSTNTGAKVFQTVRPSVISDATSVSTLGIDNLGSSVVFFFVINNTPASGNIENGYLGSDILANNFINSSSILPNQTIFHDVYTYSTSPQFNVTQSYSITTPSLSGSVTRIHRSEDEFYNGELSGSTLIISNGELNEDCAQFKFINPKGASYGIRSYNSEDDDFGIFIDSNQKPLKGFIQTWFQNDAASTPLPPPNPSL